MCFNDFLCRFCPVIGLNMISSLLGNEHTQLPGPEIISSTSPECLHQVTLCSVQIFVQYTYRILYQGGLNVGVPYIYIYTHTRMRTHTHTHGGKSFENLLPSQILWSSETDQHFLATY
jgi:hypothetical protein